MSSHDACSCMADMMSDTSRLLTFWHIQCASALAARLVERADCVRVIDRASPLSSWLVGRAPARSAWLIDRTASFSTGLIRRTPSLPARLIHCAPRFLRLVYGATTLTVRLVDGTATTFGLI